MKRRRNWEAWSSPPWGGCGLQLEISPVDIPLAPPLPHPCVPSEHWALPKHPGPFPPGGTSRPMHRAFPSAAHLKPSWLSPSRILSLSLQVARNFLSLGQLSLFSGGPLCKRMFHQLPLLTVSLQFMYFSSR